jgi:hypothetical protein
MHEERRMSMKLPTTAAPRPSMLVFWSLLATVHCNGILGIQEADCAGECHDAGARSGEVLEEKPEPSDSAPIPNASGSSEMLEEELPPSEGVPTPNPSGSSGTAASPDTGAPASLDGRVPTSDPAPTGLVDIITAACADQVTGEPFCVVNHRVICNEAGAPDSVSVCTDADHCLRGSGPDCAICSDADDGACGGPVCAANQRRCQDGQLQVCNADGSGFLLEQQCTNEASCDPDTGCAAPECTPDQRRCRGDTLEVCDSSGTFILQEQCASGTTCSEEQGCVGGACAANERRCQGANLQQCNEERTRFETIQSCGNANLCDAAAARCIE